MGGLLPLLHSGVTHVTRAGTDVDCGSFVPKFAQSALDKGVVNETDIDAALHNLMLMKIRLGYFDQQPSPLASIGADQVCSTHARELARDAARQGTVLLKNEAATLPLTKGMSIAAIGPNIALSKTVALYYAGEPCDHKYWTLQDALMQYASKVAAVPGLSSVTSSDSKDFPAAAAAAASADAVVFALGNDLTVESEGHDRDEIALYAGQIALVRYVCDSLAASDSSKRVVAVTFGGGMIDLSPILNGSCISAGQPLLGFSIVSHACLQCCTPATRPCRSLGWQTCCLASCLLPLVSPPPCCPRLLSTRWLFTARARE